MSSSVVKRRRVVRINWKVAGGLVALALTLAAAGWSLNAWQEARVQREALEVARALEKKAEFSLAVRHVNQYLRSHPDDLEALQLRAQLLERGEENPLQILEAARAYEQIVRMVPEDPVSLEARRRLVDLYVKYGKLLEESSIFFQLPPDLAALESRYQTAETHARQLLERGKNPADHRLLAWALDGLAVPGKPEALEEAIKEYRIALKFDPRDAVTAERLAQLYLTRKKDAPRAELVLDDLLQANPERLETYLARHRFFVRLRRDDKAQAELKKAAAIAPGDVAVLVAGAEDALRRGDTEGARAILAKVDEKHRGSPRVLMVKGLIEFGEERPDDAIEAWRRGLMGSAGTDAEMTWWLCYALLQVGKVEEARPLIEQYQRLSGPEAPLNALLGAMYFEKTGRPARAVRILERAPEQFGERWLGIVFLSLGRVYEAVFEETKAVEAYRRSLQLDPNAVVPRLALAKLRLAKRPDEAVAELRAGLKRLPNDPSLWTALAGVLLRIEASHPRERRAWGEFDAVFRKAEEVAGGTSAIALLRADRLSIDGREAEAIAALEEAVAKSPHSATVAVALAEGLARRGATAKALEILNRASTSAGAGDQIALRMTRARTLVAMARGREARDALVADVDRLPPSDRPRAWAALGQLELEQGNSDRARTAFVEWSRLVPDDPRPRLALVDLEIERGDEPAIRSAIEAIKQTVGEEDVAYRMARAKQLVWERDASNPPAGSRDASLEQAARLVDAVLLEVPQLPSGQMLKAQILERQGRLDEAISYYESAWDHHIDAALPRLVELMIRRQRYDSLNRLRERSQGSPVEIDLLSARALVSAGDRTQAARIADQVSRDLPDAPSALAWQARMLTVLGRLDDAEATLRTVTERQPGQLEPWLALLKYQAQHRRVANLQQTLPRALAAVRSDRPDLVRAACLAATGDRAAADKAYADLLAARRDDVPTLVAAARYYEEVGQPTRAEACLSTALRREPANRPAARQLATLLSARTGDASAWQRALNVLGPEGPADPPEDRLARAIVLTRSPDRPVKAKGTEALEALVADLPVAHPVAPSARDYLARVLLEAGNPTRASQVVSSSAAAGNPAAIALYAQALIQSKRPDSAEWQLDRLAAVNPGDPHEPALRARALWDRSRPVEAAAALERAYLNNEDSPNGESLGREVFHILADLGTDQARIADRVGRRIARKVPSASWMPALVAARAGKVDDALELVRPCMVPGHPADLVEACRVVMRVATIASDPEVIAKAGALLDVAEKAEPGNDEVLILAAMLDHQRGRYAPEVARYRTLLARAPENPIGLNNLAWALCEGLHKPEEALPQADALIKVVGRAAEALDTRGVILSRLGRHDEALADLQDAVKAAPSGLHLFHLARAFQLAGQLDQAKVYRDMALSNGLTPDGVDLPERSEFQTLREL